MRRDDRQGRSNLHENDDRRGHGDRSHGMHHDAKGTMIGVGCEGMKVGNLDNGEKGQEDDAHHCRHGEPARLGATAVMPFCLKSCQKHFPRIQDTQVWMREA